MAGQDAKAETKAYTGRRPQDDQPPLVRSTPHPLRSKASTRHGWSRTSFCRPANRPGLWSQSFSRSYGSILPTSLTYIILSTRGYSPWRPDADIGTMLYGLMRLHRCFKAHSMRTRHRRTRDAFRVKQRPYLRLSRFQGVRLLTREENSSSFIERGNRFRCRRYRTSISAPLRADILSPYQR